MNPPELPPAIRVPDLYELARLLKTKTVEVEVACPSCCYQFSTTDSTPPVVNGSMADFIRDLAEFYDKRRG